MADTVLFRLHADGTCEWATAGAAPASVQHGDLSELAAACSGNRAILIADGTELTLTRANVPSRQRSTLVRAVPYALEDQFADDVDDLHFVIGDRSEGDDVDVTVVRHETLREWLGTCTQAGVSVTAVVPEQLLLPLVEEDWSLLGDGDRVVARTGRWGGFVADRSTFQVYADLALRQSESPPARVHLYGDLEDADVTFPEGVEVLPAEPRLVPMAIYAQQNVSYTKLSLLQGSYSPRAKVGRILRPWRTAAVLAGVVLCLQLGLFVAQKLQLERETGELRAEMERIYRETFPEARRVVNPQVQMERQLRDLRRGAEPGDAGVLALISLAGPVVKGSKGLEIQGLTYRNGEMVLTIAADSLERIDQLRADLLEQGGLEVEIQSASSREGRVNSRLLIRGAVG